jgi:hypothetical protein
LLPRIQSAYKALIHEMWWNAEKGIFETSLMPDGGFRDNSQAIHGLTYILWCKAVSDPARIRPILEAIMQRPSNIENRSHYPYLLYRCHAPENAYEVLLSMKAHAAW